MIQTRSVRLTRGEYRALRRLKELLKEYQNPPEPEPKTKPGVERNKSASNSKEEE